MPTYVCDVSNHKDITTEKPVVKNLTLIIFACKYEMFFRLNGQILFTAMKPIVSVMDVSFVNGCESALFYP